MQKIEQILTDKSLEALKSLYGQFLSPNQIALQKTKIEFEGDITLLVFPLTKVSKKSPEETANAIGNYLKENVVEVTGFNVVKGFLNLVIADSYWIKYLAADPSSMFHAPSSISETVMVEFSSPNTNKPLHLGHVRNNLLGISVSEILKAAGKKVVRVNLVNDRGIHICKSMLAWKKWGANKYGSGKDETPETAVDPKLRKGDHLVGHYYVRYNIASIEDGERIRKMFQGMPLKLQMAVLGAPKEDELVENPDKVLKGIEDFLGGGGKNIPQAEVQLLKEFSSALRGAVFFEVKDMLRKWEAGDKETLDLWKKMNGWVYDGFAKTYKELGVGFEKTYYESETYLLGKKIVEEGLQKGIFFRKDDGSVWIDLTNDGLDQKLVLRSDGTSVYITQDLGTVMQRLQDFKDSNVNKLIYVVGNEQDYHFKVLFLIIKKLIENNVVGFGPLSGGESGERGVGALYHLSYGMVDLPSGKMKSREGTVVDADELMEEMVNSARETTKALGKTEGMSDADAETLYHNIGLGALKYFILKVDAKKRMLFDPKESIDFNGNTGPFIQYTYARIKSVLRKAEESPKIKAQSSKPKGELQKKEREVIKLLHGFPAVIQEAADAYNPGHIANYVYDLAKEYNQFYHECAILKAENADEKNFRLELSAKTAEVIKTSLRLLGISVSERM